jgi:predicted permease
MHRVFRLPLGRARIAHEVDDELAFHIDMRVQKLIAGGLAPDVARAEALRQFGNVETVRDFCVTMDEERERAMRRANLFDELRQDLVYAARILRRNPLFTAVVVLTLALGIGANSAIFALVNAVLLRKLPVRAPNELIVIGDPGVATSIGSSSEPSTNAFSYPLYQRLRGTNPLVSGLLASGRAERLDVQLERTSRAEPEHPIGRYVSGNYFAVLGVPALLGRTFDESDDRSVGASPVVVVSHDYWMRRLAGDPRVIGRALLINGARVTVVGVTPPSFTGEVVGSATALWIPLVMQPVLMPNEPYLGNANLRWLLLIGRLSPGVTLAQATAGFTPLVRQHLVQTMGNPKSAADVDHVPVFVSSAARGVSGIRSDYAAPLLTLMVGVGVLLLIICANVATLLLARAVARGREMGVRLAIGARRGRLVRQLLTESLLLASLGAGAGLLVARWGSRLLLALASDGSRVIGLDTGLDTAVVAFTAGLSGCAVLLFGLAPALRAARVDLADTIRASASGVRGGAFTSGGGRIPLGRLLMVGQVALSLMLLVGAGLLVRSLQHVETTDTGIDRDHLMIVQVDARSAGYRGERLAALLRNLTDRLGHIPGVTAVTYSENGIFSGTEWSTTVQVAGFTPRTPNDSVTHSDEVGPGYIKAIGAHLVEGRDIAEHDDAAAPRVAVVNHTFARFYFPGRSAVGSSFRLDDTISVQIIGVIADTRDHELAVAPTRRFYRPYLQTGVDDADELKFEVRTSGNPAALMRVVRAELRAVDPALALGAIDPLPVLMRQSISEERLLTRLASGFGVLALLLAGIGLYGVMTYAVTRRTGEIGLRVALGAQARDVVAMVVGDAIRIVLVGVVLGIPLAIGAAQLLRDQLHGIGAADPVTLAVVLAVLFGSALAAALFPARRAARVAPLVALRQE